MAPGNRDAFRERAWNADRVEGTDPLPLLRMIAVMGVLIAQSPKTATLVDGFTPFFLIFFFFFYSPNGNVEENSSKENPSEGQRG